jgi:hypothetical protein
LAGDVASGLLSQHGQGSITDGGKGGAKGSAQAPKCMAGATCGLRIAEAGRISQPGGPVIEIAFKRLDQHETGLAIQFAEPVAGQFLSMSSMFGMIQGSRMYQGTRYMFKVL